MGGVNGCLNHTQRALRRLLWAREEGISELALGRVSRDLAERKRKSLWWAVWQIAILDPLRGCVGLVTRSDGWEGLA